MRTFSFGAGVQSTAVLALQALGRLPDPYDVFLLIESLVICPDPLQKNKYMPLVEVLTASICSDWYSDCLSGIGDG